MRHVVVVLVAAFIAACGGSYSHYEKGQNLVLDGIVDNVSRQDLAHDKKVYSLTAVGFENGQGVTLLGLQPGIGKGKHMHITAEFMDNINGTDVFKVKSIQARNSMPEAIVRPAPAPKPVLAAPLESGSDAVLNAPVSDPAVNQGAYLDQKKSQTQ